MVNGDKSHLTEALALHAVVHDIAEAVERLALRQFFLGLSDGSGHSEAEAATLIDFYLDHIYYYLGLPRVS